MEINGTTFCVAQRDSAVIGHFSAHNEVKLPGLQGMYGAGSKGARGAEYFAHAHAQPFSPGRGWTR